MPYDCSCRLVQYCKHPRILGDGYVGNNCVMLVGESPAEVEDRHNQVFVGSTGALFRRYMNMLLHIDADALSECGGFYYTNAVKCKVGKSANIENYIDGCRRNLIRDIETVKPSRIMLFGATAIESVVGQRLDVKNHIGGWFRRDFGYGKIPIQFCMHPTATLHNKVVKPYWECETSWAFYNPPSEKLLDAEDCAVVEVEKVPQALCLLDEMKGLKYIGYDTEFNSDTGRLYLAAFAVSANKAYVFHDEVINHIDVCVALEDLFSMDDKTFIAHSWKADAHATVRGLHLSPKLFCRMGSYWADTLSMRKIQSCEALAGLEYVEWQVGLGGHKAKLFSIMKGRQAKHYEQAYANHPELMAWYNGMDALACFRAYFHYRTLLKRDGLYSMWSDFIGPMGPVFFEMEHIGLQMDTNKMTILEDRIDDLIDSTKLALNNDSAVHRLINLGIIERAFNPNSAAHKRAVLFDANGLGLKSVKETSGGKSGKPQNSAAAAVLKQLQDESGFVRNLSFYSKLAKMKSSYVWFKYLSADGCVHSDFKQTGGRTGRSSARRPPVQTIPRGSLSGTSDEAVIMSDVRRLIREGIIPHKDDGWFDE